MKPSIYLRGNDGVTTSGHTGVTTFAMVPWLVATDKRLKANDVRVYAILAASRRGPKVSIGGRWLSECAQIARQRTAESLKRLQDAGYLEMKPAARGKRTEYTLTSPLFIEATRPKSVRRRGDRMNRPTVRSAARMQAEDNARRETA